jgi:hypothetical protein
MGSWSERPSHLTYRLHRDSCFNELHFDVFILGKPISLEPLRS